MILSYNSTLAEAAEPSVRLYLRGKTSAKNRLLGTLSWAAAFATLAFLGFSSKENVNLPIVCIAAGAWGAGLTWLTYKGAVRRRITKYVATELAGSWPRSTSCEIKEGKIITTSSKIRTTFLLTDLTAVTEDAKYLELTFGTHGLYTIPLRVFADTDEKNTFRAALSA